MGKVIEDPFTLCVDFAPHRDRMVGSAVRITGGAGMADGLMNLTTRAWFFLGGGSAPSAVLLRGTQEGRRRIHYAAREVIIFGDGLPLRGSQFVSC